MNGLIPSPSAPENAGSATTAASPARLVRPRWRPRWRTRRLDTTWLKVELQRAGPALLFGLRLWASVCLAMCIAFWLELDDPSWAGTTAAIVCQPTLGA